MIINRYVAWRVTRLMVLVLCVLSSLFTGFSAARSLSDAVNALLPTSVIAQSVALQTLIALDVLVPISLYVAVVWAFAKFYRDAEIPAMLALRVGPLRVLEGALVVSLLTALVVAALCLFVRPWAYQRLHELSHSAAASFDVQDMRAGTFYTSHHGEQVIFIEHRSKRTAPGRRVFVRLKHRDGTRVLYAMRAERVPPLHPTGTANVRLFDVHIYDIGPTGEVSAGAIQAGQMLLDPISRRTAPIAYSALAASSTHLSRSRAPHDIAEFQWRLITPVSALLLAILAIFLSRSRPREGSSPRIGAAIAFYFGYYLLCNALRIWVQKSQIPPFPGLWWAPALLSVVLLAVLYGPRLRGRLGFL